MSLEIGQTLGKYEIQGRLGGGGYADVYKGYHPGLRKSVAIKVLKPERRGDPAFTEAFKGEARNAANLGHPNIVVIHDVGEQDGVPYIVMEYAPGGDLREQIRRRGALPRRDVCRWFDQIAAALNHAHRREFVHCDVKPSNILLDVDQRVKLTDFGIARSLVRSQEEGIRKNIGTPPYMSPEHVLGKELDHRSDIYSLGIVLFEMLTGRVPFREGSGSRIMRAHVTQQPPSPSSLNPDLPDEVDKVVLRALAKNPDARYQSTLQMARELKKAMELELGGGASPPAPPAPPSAAPPDHRLIWAIVGVVAVVSVAALLLWSRVNRSPQPTPTPTAAAPSTLLPTSKIVIVTPVTKSPIRTITEIPIATRTPTPTLGPTSTLEPTATLVPTNTPVTATATSSPTPVPAATPTIPPPPPPPPPTPSRTPKPL